MPRLVKNNEVEKRRGFDRRIEPKNEHVKKNRHGRRIGESHPRAVLTDHEVDLLLALLDEREAVVGAMEFAGVCQVAIWALLAREGLSYRCLALKFEVHKSTVAKIAQGRRRCQSVEG